MIPFPKIHEDKSNIKTVEQSFPEAHSSEVRHQFLLHNHDLDVIIYLTYKVLLV